MAADRRSEQAAAQDRELLPCECHGDDLVPYCPRHTPLSGEISPAASTESREQRRERWIDWTNRAMQFCPLSLYDEFQKLGEIAVGEMLNEIDKQASILDELCDWAQHVAAPEGDAIHFIVELAEEALKDGK